jgi:hypothetical protein
MICGIDCCSEARTPLSLGYHSRTYCSHSPKRIRETGIVRSSDEKPTPYSKPVESYFAPRRARVRRKLVRRSSTPTKPPDDSQRNRITQKPSSIQTLLLMTSPMMAR